MSPAEHNTLRLRIYHLEAAHRDAVDAYIKTRQASHQRDMVAISRQLAELRQEYGS